MTDQSTQVNGVYRNHHTGSMTAILKREWVGDPLANQNGWVVELSDRIPGSEKNVRMQEVEFLRHWGLAGLPRRVDELERGDVLIFSEEASRTVRRCSPSRIDPVYLLSFEEMGGLIAKAPHDVVVVAV